uniref:Putative secreted protein n=1 Tax=Anopheles marajoara TaxID=58244 RepID=A0A2M4CAH0_9DIPT
MCVRLFACVYVCVWVWRVVSQPTAERNAPCSPLVSLSSKLLIVSSDLSFHCAVKINRVTRQQKVSHTGRALCSQLRMQKVMQRMVR